MGAESENFKLVEEPQGPTKNNLENRAYYAYVQLLKTK